MIVKPRDADAFLSSPPPDVVGVLLYGPDAGLVAERAKSLVAAITGEESSAFGVVELSKRDLDSDPRRLADELAAIPLTGGRPVVRLRDAGDELASLIEDALEPGGGFLVVEAGELPPRSALRKFFEASEQAAGIACYLDDQRDLAGLITAALAEQGLTIGRAALAELARSMGSDRLVTRQELAKLIAYMGDAQAQGGGTREVSVEAVRASIGDSAEVTLDDLAFAIGSGDAPGFERAYQRAQAEGTAAVRIIRSTTRHFQRLHQAASALAKGETLDKAMGGLRPAVFWKQKQAFGAQVSAWGLARLEAALVELLESEIEAKGSGSAPELMTQRKLLRLTLRAPRQAGR